MKWRDLTPAQLDKTASDLRDRAHDMKFEREIIAEEQGFDLVAALECVARRLDREAKRRQSIAFGTRPGRKARTKAETEREESDRKWFDEGGAERQADLLAEMGR